MKRCFRLALSLLVLAAFLADPARGSRIISHGIQPAQIYTAPAVDGGLGRVLDSLVTTQRKTREFQVAFDQLMKKLTDETENSVKSGRLITSVSRMKVR